MAAQEVTPMKDEQWGKVQKLTGRDILSIVMDLRENRITCGAAMDDISRHCEAAFQVGVEEGISRERKPKA